MPQIFQAMLLGPLMSSKNGKQMRYMGIARIKQKDLLSLKELLESGKVAPVVDKTYPLNEVPSAMSYLLEGHAHGKIVVQIASS